ALIDRALREGRETGRYRLAYALAPDDPTEWFLDAAMNLSARPAHDVDAAREALDWITRAMAHSKAPRLIHYGIRVLAASRAGDRTDAARARRAERERARQPHVLPAAARPHRRREGAARRRHRAAPGAPARAREPDGVARADGGRRRAPARAAALDGGGARGCQGPLRA